MAHKDLPFTVRDRRRTHFFTIDNVILDDYGAQVGPYGLAVYMALCRFADSESTCWPSLQTIADRTGMSRKQVIREIKKLESLGLIAVLPQVNEETGKQHTNLYVLLDTGGDTQSPPRDTQSPPPGTHSHPPRDTLSPKQNPKNKTHSLEENTDNNGGGGFSVPEEITDTFTDITGEEPTEQDNQHLAELASYPQWVVKETFFALRERILNSDKGTIRNKAAWLVGTAKRKAKEENEGIHRIEEVNRTLTARRRYEVPEAYRDIVVGCH